MANPDFGQGVRFGRADDWYRLLFQSSSDAIMILDDERFLDCNEATLELFDVPDRETFCSLHPADLSPPTQADGESSLTAADSRIREALTNGQARFEWTHCRHDGTVFPAEVWLTRVAASNHRLLQATVRDLTERKRMESEIQRLNRQLERRVAEQDVALRESESKFRGLVEKSMVGVYIIQDGRFPYCNPRMAEIFGYEQQEIIDRMRVRDLVAEQDRDLVEGNIRRRLEGGLKSLHYGFRGRRRDGGVIQVEVYGSATNYNGKPAVIGTLLDVTEQYEAREALSLQNAYFRQLFENAPDGIVILDNREVVVDANPAFLELFGYSLDELKGKPLNEYIIPESLESEGMSLSMNVLDSKMVQAETVRLKRDGTPVHVSIMGVPINLNRDQIGVYGVYRDITERKRAERELQYEKDLAQVTLHAIGEAVIRTDRDGHVQYMNPVAEDLTGWSTDEAGGLELTSIVRIRREGVSESLESPLRRCLDLGTSVTEDMPVLLESRDGREFAIEISASPLRNRKGRIIGVVLVFRDVSERARAEREMAYQASHDALTGLHNRYEFESRAQLMLGEVQERQCRHTMLYIDLDQFKVVNDTCGHSAGDELLRQLGELMRTHIRASDTLARLGGDEFGVLLRECSLKRARVIADDLSRTVQDFRFGWENRTFSIGASIGVVEINDSIKSVADLLRAADSACYAAKDKGRNQVRVYHPSDRDLTRFQEEMSWVSTINSALEEGRLELYCQAIRPLEDGPDHRSRFELLVRMRGERGELVEPAKFIPAAERYGLMPALDRWVVDRAMQGIRKAQDRGCPRAVYSINISGVTLSQGDFLEYVKERLARHDVDPSWVCFEITETAAIVSLSDAVEFVDGARQMGASIALDDFGTGLSSFAYLKSLKVDYLKIDGAFVKDMADDPIDEAMVETIHRVGRIMGIRTVAEFAESDAIIERLRRIGVDYVQGYAVHEPEPWTVELTSEIRA